MPVNESRTVELIATYLRKRDIVGYKTLRQYSVLDDARKEAYRIHAREILQIIAESLYGG